MTPRRVYVIAFYGALLVMSVAIAGQAAANQDAPEAVWSALFAALLGGFIALELLWPWMQVGMRRSRYDQLIDKARERAAIMPMYDDDPDEAMEQAEFIARLQRMQTFRVDGRSSAPEWVDRTSSNPEVNP